MKWKGRNYCWSRSGREKVDFATDRKSVETVRELAGRLWGTGWCVLTYIRRCWITFQPSAEGVGWDECGMVWLVCKVPRF